MRLLAHLSHWYWQLLAAGPSLIGGGIPLAEREQVDRELDDILGS